jgi:threonine/homoserine/homoserine lactone efflux protein
MAVTPGPNNIMLMTSGLNYGVKRSIPHLLGICIGFPLMVLMVGLGMSTVFSAYPALHSIIKVLGVVYLLYLAWKIAASSPASLNSSSSKPSSSPLTFMQSALFQWINPKAWIMATGAIATYTTATDDLFWQVMIISGVFFMMAIPCVGIWLFFGVALKQYLTSAWHQKVFNVSMAVLLVISIIPVLSEWFETI